MANRVSWQQQRRAETRESLLDAAYRVFARTSYAETTVNDILAEAEVGRTSFYKHFNDKLAISETLFEQMMPDLSGAFAEIAKCDKIDRQAVAQWLDRLVDEYSRNAAIMRVFAQVQTIEPGFEKAVSKAQRAMMERLGVRFPLFARAASAADTRDPDYTRATTLIDMIDHVCSTIAIRKVPIDNRQAIDFLAELVTGILTADCQH